MLVPAFERKKSVGNGGVVHLSRMGQGRSFSVLFKRASRDDVGIVYRSIFGWWLRAVV